MKFTSTSTIVLSTFLIGSVRAATYSVVDVFEGESFFSGFSFFSQADPTHGRVNYVTEEQAKSLGLVTAFGSSEFILRADSTTTLGPYGPGRNSFRITSNKQYGTHVAVFNLQHMPEGCGTWPAIWENGDNWPYGGEVDILEGVNDQVPNTSSLHTGPGCTMPVSRLETGTPTGLDCNAFDAENSGCGAHTTAPNNYGPAFNENGGGWYALERTPTFIKIWFWPRYATNVPQDVRSGSNQINTDAWGTPTAYFPNTQCDINGKFSPSNIIINLTFCGDWAGSAYGASGCPGNCVDYVNNNPSAFAGAYFEFLWVMMYE